ncbi:hypothetical protein H4Q26_001056 [Puccinia striiformis f. sp. tritici PST-130]|nr:hypothetical protein H4Q26_001056 [Puccinia striiformis f. sp. tritici PST-130]
MVTQHETQFHVPVVIQQRTHTASEVAAPSQSHDTIEIALKSVSRSNHIATTYAARYTMLHTISMKTGHPLIPPRLPPSAKFHQAQHGLARHTLCSQALRSRLRTFRFRVLRHGSPGNVTSNEVTSSNATRPWRRCLSNAYTSGGT